jgi:hypothetical protein
MGYQTVRALTTVRHDGKLRIPGQTIGDNAQDFIVEDSWATKLIAAGFVSAVAAASAPIELRPVAALMAQYQGGVFVGLQTEKGDSVGSGGPGGGITQAQADARYAPISQLPKTIVLPNDVSWINSDAVNRTVTVTGGTVSAVALATAEAPTVFTNQSGTSGAFSVQPGCAIKLTYTVKPTSVVIS